MTTSLDRRRAILGIATLAPLGVFIVFLVTVSGGPGPTLDEVCALAQASRFDLAQARGAEYLRRFPDDSRAILVMAELALAGPTPDPDRALAYLDRIVPDSRSQAAWALTDQGNAFYLLSRFDRSETCWKQALGKDPSVLPAGRRLFDLLSLQGRWRDASSVVLAQLDHEPEPRDRLRLLTKLVQLEVDPPEPWSIINQCQPVVRANPADLPTSLACGLSLVLVSRADEGLAILRHAVDRNPGTATAWDALLTGLELASRTQDLANEWSRVPPTLAADPRFAKHQGHLEQEKGRWDEASRAHRRAWEHEQDNRVGYRLRRALVLAGHLEEAGHWDQIVLDYRSATKQARTIVERFNTTLNANQSADPRDCLAMAGLRERMGRALEARAWRRLATCIP